MLRCVRCGTKSPANSQFCDECGGRLNDSGATIAANRQSSNSGSNGSARPTMTEEKETNNNLAEVATAVSPNSLVSWKAEDNNNATEVGGGLTNVTSIANAPAFAHARLIIERGKNAGKEFVLSESEINIGRWDADNGVFPDVDLDADDTEAKVSRRHARIVRYGNQYLVEDLGSTNGTFINRGRRLLPGSRQIIEDGDEIIVGKTFLRFKVIR